MQHVIGELRRGSNGCQIQNVTAIRIAIAAVEITIVGILIFSALVVVEDIQKADAMRQRVVRAKVDSTGGTTLNGEQHSVVITGAAVFTIVQHTDELAILRAFQVEAPSKIRVVRR